MRVSAVGRAAITQREGCRLVAYRDSRGIPTIGVGHVDMTPPETVMGMRITKDQADALLAADLAPVEATIARSVTVPMSQNECDALASLGFNIGIGGLARSTVVGRLNRGDRAGAAQAFLMWSHPPELTGRRRAEAKQFVTPDAPAAPAPAHAPVKPDTSKNLILIGVGVREGWRDGAWWLFDLVELLGFRYPGGFRRRWAQLCLRAR